MLPKLTRAALFSGFVARYWVFDVAFWAKRKALRRRMFSTAAARRASSSLSASLGALSPISSR
jgi:hypothetical protein